MINIIFMGIIGISFYPLNKCGFPETISYDSFGFIPYTTYENFCDKFYDEGQINTEKYGIAQIPMCWSIYSVFGTDAELLVYCSKQKIRKGKCEEE